jgi:polygalacturonase
MAHENERRAKAGSKANKDQADKRKRAVEGTAERSKIRKANLERGYPVSDKRGVLPDAPKTEHPAVAQVKQAVKDIKGELKRRKEARIAKALKKSRSKPKPKPKPKASSGARDRADQTKKLKDDV